MTKDDFISLKLKAFDQIEWIINNGAPDTISQISGIIGFIGIIELDLLREGVLNGTPDKIPEGTNNPCDICKFANKGCKDWPCNSCIRGGGKMDYFRL